MWCSNTTSNKEPELCLTLRNTQITQAEILINEVSSGIRYPVSCVHAVEYNALIHSMNTTNWISDSRTYFMWRKTEM